jgi:putative addiction module CopG family antidote
MNIHLSSSDQNFINAMITGGCYHDSEQLIRQAVQLLKEKEQDRYKLITALEKGEHDIEQGRTVPYTKDFLKECAENARKNQAAGLKPNPDVCP